MKAASGSGNSANSQNEDEDAAAQSAAINPGFKAAESSSVSALHLSNDDSTSCSFQQEIFVVFPASVVLGCSWWSRAFRKAGPPLQAWL